MSENREMEVSRPSSPNALLGWVKVLPSDIKERDLPIRDISELAVWTLSSCKNGYGINELLSDSADKYWQSDGPQPHTVTIEFQRKTDVAFLLLYLDFKNDESYTPSKVIVKAGLSLQNMETTLPFSFGEPCGWQLVDLRNSNGDPMRVMVVQLQVVQNHQNGRDTHIRHVRVAGPSRSRFCPESRLMAGKPHSALSFRPRPVNQAFISSKFFDAMSIR